MIEVTLRTVQGRFLLRPGRRLNELVLGVIGRAQRLSGMKIHGLVVLSNHLHALLSPDSPQQLASFMAFLGGNLAREAGKLHDWRDKFWARRYRSIVVSDEEDAQVARLAYLLAHGVKEGLVARPQDWPGVHCAEALLRGCTLEGVWLDRTAEYEARRRGETAPRGGFSSSERIAFSPLPCWKHLPDDAYRLKVAAVLDALARQARAERQTAPLGRRAILRQDPHHRPLHSDRSPAPLVHAATRAVRVMLRIAYWRFVGAFREAASKLRRGHRLARFPPGSFPPPLPFVAPAC